MLRELNDIEMDMVAGGMASGETAPEDPDAPEAGNAAPPGIGDSGPSNPPAGDPPGYVPVLPPC